MTRLWTSIGAAVLSIAIFSNAAVPAEQAPPAEIVPLASEVVYSTAMSRDFKHLLVGSDSKVLLWDVDSGRLVRAFGSHPSQVVSVAFSRDESVGLAATSDGTVDYWELATGKLLKSVKGPFESTGSARLLPDLHQVVTTAWLGSSADEGRVALWDFASGALVRRFAKDVVDANGIIDPGSFVSSASGTMGAAMRTNGSLTIWDLQGGAQILKIETGGQNSNSVNSRLTLSSDGRLVAFASDSDGYGIRVWDTTTGTLKRRFEGHLDRIGSIAFSADDRQLLSGSNDKTAKLWDIASGKLIRTLQIGKPATYASFLPGGMAIIVGGFNGIELWDIAAGKRRTDFGSMPAISSLSFASDGTILASVQDSGITRWNPRTGALIGSERARKYAATDLTDDGSLALQEGPNGALTLWDAAKNRQLWSISAHGGTIYASSLSADHGIAFSFAREDGAKLWDGRTGKMLRSFATALDQYGSPQRIESAALSPDGKTLALELASLGGVQFVDVASGEVLATANDLWGLTTYAPDSRSVLLIHAGDAGYVLVDVRTGKPVREFAGSEIGGHALFSPDGRLLLIWSSKRTPDLWDVATGKLLRSLEGFNATIWNGAFSPDGSRIAFAQFNATISHWDVASGQLLASTIVGADGAWVTITPEGFFDSSARGARLLSIVRGMDLLSIDQMYQALHRPDLVSAKLAGDPDGLVREASAKTDLAVVTGSGPAPKTAILSPAEPSSVGVDTLDVTAALTDQGGGIGKVEWHVNGITLGLDDNRGLARVDAPTKNPDGLPAKAGQTITVKRRLALSPGENRIEILAYNAKNLVSSEPVQVTVTRASSAGAAKPTLYVVSVGINDYWDGRLKLNYARPDAEAVANELKRAGGSLYAAVEITTVFDEAATAARLEAVFAELSDKVRPEDVFVFYLAGHGKTEDGRYYFLPYDFRFDGEASVARSGVDQDRFQKWFAGIKARKSVLLYDSCESGTLTRGLERVTALDRLTRAVGRTILSAASEDEPALEGYRGHGVFTYVILDALSAGDSNGDGLIGVNELVSRVDEQVPELSFAAFHQRQVPMKNVVGTDFPLAKKLTGIASGGGGVETYSTKPTHVVIAPAKVRRTPDAAAAVMRELAVGTLVTLIGAESGWVLVAKDGRRIGYVGQDALAAVQ